MIYVNDIADVKGRWIRDDVQVLEEPRHEGGKWVALAIAYGMLALIELRVTPGKRSEQP